MIVLNEGVKLCYSTTDVNNGYWLLQELVPTSESNLARSLMYIFEMLMSEACEDEKATKDKNFKSWIVVRNLV